MKILIELELDGIEIEKGSEKVYLDFVKESLNMTSSSITILWHEELHEK